MQRRKLSPPTPSECIASRVRQDSHNDLQRSSQCAVLGDAQSQEEATGCKREEHTLTLPPRPSSTPALARPSSSLVPRPWIPSSSTPRPSSSSLPSTPRPSSSSLPSSSTPRPSSSSLPSSSTPRPSGLVAVCRGAHVLIVDSSEALSGCSVGSDVTDHDMDWWPNAPTQREYKPRKARARKRGSGRLKKARVQNVTNPGQAFELLR